MPKALSPSGTARPSRSRRRWAARNEKGPNASVSPEPIKSNWGGSLFLAEARLFIRRPKLTALALSHRRCQAVGQAAFDRKLSTERGVRNRKYRKWWFRNL